MSQPLRPVILILGQAGALSGGDVHALRLAEAWGRRNAAPSRIVGSPDLARFVASPADVTLVALHGPLDAAMRTNAAAFGLGVLLRAVRAVRHCRSADVIVPGSHLAFDVVPAFLAAKLFRRPIVTFVYHVLADTGRPPSPRARVAVAMERLSLYLLRRGRALVFVDNREARSGLIRRGFDEALLFDTRNAYDPNFVVPTPSPAAPARVVFVGRLVERKGVLDVIELVRRLQSEMPDLEIDMIGDGPLREHVEGVKRAEGLEHLHVHGFVDEHVKWRILSEARLFVAPSVEEGWGIAVGEALLAGVPVVAVDLPAYSHFPDHVVRAQSGGPPFVELVMKVLRDRPCLDTLAENARAGRSSLPTWAAVVSNDIDVIERSASGTAYRPARSARA